ncbi:kinase-like domain-containing protein [Mycena galericulata]|nr:kinase-like domain-containing protein [Mycena galericulata]
MFDFPSYLGSKLSLPPADLKVDILTGGLTNVTVRATFGRSINLSSSQQTFTSVVLKFAPPFVASDSTQPMSVHRQVIEATALRYLADEPEMRAWVAQFPELKILQLIHHDTASRVLWITDLGLSQTLSEFLTTSPSDPAIRDIATALGTFMATFCKITANPAPETVMSEHGVPDAEILSSRIRTAMQAKEKLEPCLGMVDFWPGSIIIGTGNSQGLIDWEYFGLSTPGAEIDMFAAHLHLIILNSKTTPEVREAVRTFVSVFLDSYATCVPPPSLYFRRQALVAYGREMVTAIDFFAAEPDKDTQKRVLDAGVGSLRAGSESEIEAKLIGSTIRLWDEFPLTFRQG